MGCLATELEAAPDGTACIAGQASRKTQNSTRRLYLALTHSLVLFGTAGGSIAVQQHIGGSDRQDDTRRSAREDQRSNYVRNSPQILCRRHTNTRNRKIMGKAASVFGASRGVQRLEKDNEAMQGFFDWKGTEDP